MPLKGIPDRIHPEFLYTLARMGHGDKIVIADANFPSDSVAAECVVKLPIRAQGSTAEVLTDILKLFPLDSYSATPLIVMDRVDSDKLRNLHVPAYDSIASVAGDFSDKIHYMERFQFYDCAKSAFAVIQTDDRSLYANVIISKGVL
jgi:L-fucose mutarotase